MTFQISRRAMLAGSGTILLAASASLAQAQDATIQ